MNFGVCDFSRFGGYGLALAALALMTATRNLYSSSFY